MVTSPTGTGSPFPVTVPEASGRGFREPASRRASSKAPGTTTTSLRLLIEPSRRQAVAPRGQLPVKVDVHDLAQEMHRAVGHGEVTAAAVLAAEPARDGYAVARARDGRVKGALE